MHVNWVCCAASDLSTVALNADNRIDTLCLGLQSLQLLQCSATCIWSRGCIMVCKQNNKSFLIYHKENQTIVSYRTSKLQVVLL